MEIKILPDEWSTTHKLEATVIILSKEKKAEHREYRFLITGTSPLRVSVFIDEVKAIDHYEHPRLMSLEAAKIYVAGLMNALSFYQGGTWDVVPF